MPGARYCRGKEGSPLETWERAELCTVLLGPYFSVVLVLRLGPLYPGVPPTLCVAEDDLELLTFLLSSLKC